MAGSMDHIGTWVKPPESGSDRARTPWSHLKFPTSRDHRDWCLWAIVPSVGTGRPWVRVPHFGMITVRNPHKDR